jgi:large subunit ribosomal protein L17
MRHRVSGRALGRQHNQKKALFLGLIRSFFEHGKLTSTQAKVSAIRGKIEKLCALSVTNTIPAKRELFRFLQSQSWVNNVTSTLSAEFSGKTDNFTTIKNIKIRQGDSAVIVRLSLIKDLKFSKTKIKPEVVKEVKPEPKKDSKKPTVKITTRVKKTAKKA